MNLLNAYYMPDILRSTIHVLPYQTHQQPSGVSTTADHILQDIQWGKLLAQDHKADRRQSLHSSQVCLISFQNVSNCHTLFQYTATFGRKLKPSLEKNTNDQLFQ